MLSLQVEMFVLQVVCAVGLGDLFFESSLLNESNIFRVTVTL